MKEVELDLLVSHGQISHISLITGMEIVAMFMHAQISPTNWLTITPEQRNNSRRRANTTINEALHFWESEVRKAQPPT
jgi:hypothetical protein